MNYYSYTLILPFCSLTDFFETYAWSRNGGGVTIATEERRELFLLFTSKQEIVSMTWENGDLGYFGILDYEGHLGFSPSPGEMQRTILLSLTLVLSFATVLYCLVSLFVYCSVYD